MPCLIHTLYETGYLIMTALPPENHEFDINSKLNEYGIISSILLPKKIYFRQSTSQVNPRGQPWPDNPGPVTMTI